MKFLVFGSCNIDRVYTVPHFVCAGETLCAGKLEQFVGGKGLNQAISLSRAGAKVYFAGAVGEDGEMLRSALRDSDVNTELLSELSCPSGHAIIQIDPNGENCILLAGGANREIGEEYAKEVLSHFGKGDIILLQNEISSMPYIAHEASKRGMKVYLNPSPYDSVIDSIDLRDIHCLILNEIELLMLCKAKGISKDTREEMLSCILHKYPHLKLMLTLGSDGCMYKDSDTIAQHPIFKVDTVDTTGAGDTFTGYFISSVEGGDDIYSALKLACAASAMAVRVKGASVSIPHMCEVKKFAEEYGLS